MTNNTAKKQNRLMLVALVFILAAATALVAITGTANRKKESDPPLDNKTEITDKTDGEKQDGEKQDGKTPDAAKDSAIIKSNEGTKDQKKPDEKNTATVKDTENKPEDKLNSNDQDKNNDKSEKTSTDNNAAVDVIATVEDEELPVFMTPVDGIVIKGASLTLPVFSYTMNDYRTHSGLDFACSPGSPVFAAADGEVAKVYEDPMMGVTVSIAHSGGAMTVYKGLSEDSLGMVSTGDKISRGDVIGVSGDTALIENAEENHLHFELSVNGETKDPAEYMSVVFLDDLTED